MFGKPFGAILLSAALLAAGLAGIAALWSAWPRTSGTSPLAAMFAAAWSCAYLVATVLTWRRSRLAPGAFVAATGLLLPVASFIFPGGDVFLLPSLTVVGLIAFLGFRYLTRTSVRTA